MENSMENMNSINEQALENVVGACGNSTNDGARFQVDDRVTCYRGIHWVVLQVIGFTGDFSYLCTAHDIPTEWRNVFKDGEFKYLPEDQLSYGWN